MIKLHQNIPFTLQMVNSCCNDFEYNSLSKSVLKNWRELQELRRFLILDPYPNLRLFTCAKTSPFFSIFLFLSFPCKSNVSTYFFANFFTFIEHSLTSCNYCVFLVGRHFLEGQKIRGGGAMNGRRLLFSNVSLIKLLIS